MKELIKKSEIAQISGRGKCICDRALRSGEKMQTRSDGVLANYKTMWVRDYPTKSKCLYECCEVSGGKGITFGVGRAVQMC